MKNVLKGSIFYVIIAIIVVLGINYIRGNLVENTGVTYSQFQKYVAQNKVSGVEVRQNSQGVTGELTVHLKDGEYRTLDVSDVTKAEDLLEQKNISYKVTVEKESVFMTTVLPMLLIAVSDFSCSLIIYFLLFLFRGKFDILYYLLNIMIPELVYTMVVTIFLYFIILKINQKLETIEKRSAVKFV